MNPIVIAEKTLHKMAMFGHVSNGGGVISISNGIGIKFIAVNDTFVVLQILHSGIGVPIKTQSWIKSKAIKKPQLKKSQVTLEDIKNEELI